jgi:hypothetical protein
MRTVAIGFAIVLASVLLPEVPAAEAAQKGKSQANSNLAAGDIHLLESIRGGSKARLKAKGGKAREGGNNSFVRRIPGGTGKPDSK